MILTNLTISAKGILQSYRPDQQCFDWCAIQHISHSNNLELKIIMFPLFAYIFLILYFSSKEIKLLQPYQDTFLYIA